MQSGDNMSDINILDTHSKDYLTKELVSRTNNLTFQNYLGVLPNLNSIVSNRADISQTFSELQADPHIHSCIQSRKSGVLSKKWQLIGNQASYEYEFVAKQLQSLDLHNLFSNILDAMLTGYQVLEIMWDEDQKSNYFVSKIESKPIEWFFYDYNNEIKYRSKSNPKGVSLPEYKFLIPRNNPTFKNPYGEALLSKCYWSLTIKSIAYRFWINFLEKYGMPLIIGQYTYPPTPEELSNLSIRLNELVNSQTIATPPDITIDIKDIGQSKSVDLYLQLIKLANAEISKALLSETLTTELDSGSYAASITHFQVRNEVILGDVKLLEQTINQLINFIGKVNNFDLCNLPKFEFIQNE